MKIIHSHIFLFFLCMAQSSYAAEKIRSLAMTKVMQNHESLLIICKKLSIDCREERTALWSVNMNDKPLFFIISDQVKLTQISFENGQYEFLNQWDLKQYLFAEFNVDDEMVQGEKYIFSAIYPVNKNEFAIALIQPWHTSYSGGGRSEEFADFVHLKEKGNYKTILKSIPFYSLEQIRACFTEREYQLKKHCHDENFTTLSIHYQDVAQPFYQWRFSYVHTDWPAGTMNKKIIRTKQKVVQFMK